MSQVGLCYVWYLASSFRDPGQLAVMCIDGLQEGVYLWVVTYRYFIIFQSLKIFILFPLHTWILTGSLIACWKMSNNGFELDYVLVLMSDHSEKRMWELLFLLLESLKSGARHRLVVLKAAPNPGEVRRWQGGGVVIARVRRDHRLHRHLQAHLRGDGVGGSLLCLYMPDFSGNSYRPLLCW